MLKQKYFLADIFILSAEKQPIKLSWRKIVWLLTEIIRKVDITEGLYFPCKKKNEMVTTPYYAHIGAINLGENGLSNPLVIHV